MKIRLQVFDNRCEACGAAFRTFHQAPHDYGAVAFVSSRGHVAVALPDEDPIWSQVMSLLGEVAGHKLSDREKAVLFPLVFERTVDGPSDDRLYMWGRIPCPQCAGRRRSFFAPVEPAEFIDAVAEAVSHGSWAALSRSEKQHEARQAISNEVEVNS